MKTKFSVTVTNETNALTKKKNNNLKDYAIKVLHSTCQQIWKTLQWP